MSKVPQKQSKRAPKKRTEVNEKPKVARREIENLRRTVRTNARTNNASRLEAKVAESICLPGEQGTSIYRWASQFNSVKTALAHPFQILPLNFGGVQPANAELARFEQLSVITRNPLCSLILYDQNAAGTNSVYTLFGRGGGGGTPTGSPSYKIDSQDSADVAFTEGDCTTGPTSFQAHGPTMYPGSVSNNPAGRFFWFDKGTSLVVTIECGLNINAVLQCDYWGPNGFNSNFISGQITLASDTPQIVTVIPTGSAPGYYSLRIKNDSNQDDGIFTLSDMTYTVTSSVFRHLACPSINATIGSVRGVRVLGHSIKLTNTSSLLNRGGQIIARQCASGSNWQTYILPDVYGHLSSQIDAISLGAKDGMYGFLKITDAEDLGLMKYHVVNSEATLVDSKWPIDAPHSFIAMVTRTYDQQSSSFQCTDRLVLEFETDNMFFDTDVASMPVDVYTRALSLIKDVPQFYENPVHFGEIWSQIQNFVSKAVDGVAKYAPLIGKVAAML